MRDEIVQHANTVLNTIPSGSPADAIGNLEPLAVPMGRFTSILRRHFFTVLFVFVLGVGGTGMVVRMIPKQYTAEAAILIQPQRTQVSDLQAISTDSTDISSLIRTQIDIVRSQSLAINVVKALNLQANAEFAPHAGLTARIKALILKIARQPSAPAVAMAPEDAIQIAAGTLSGKLGFANETRSSVLNVSVTTGDPALSATIANEIANQFLDFKRQEKYAAMQRAHDWFQEQMGKLVEQLRAADLAVEQYRQQHGLDELPPDDGNASRTETVNRQQLNAISHQLSEVTRETALKQGQLAQAQAVMRGTLPADTLPQVIASPMIMQLLPQISAAAGHEAQLASMQGPGNPELVAVRAQLLKLQARASQEMAKVAISLNSEIQASRAQQHLLQDQMERLRSAVSNENSALIGLQAPQTKARATRAVYDSFLNRATQLANVAGIQEQDASLVSAARAPLGPSAPQVSRLLVVAVLLSSVLGVGLACLLERLRTGFSMPEQIEGTLGLPLVAVVPKVSRTALRGRRRAVAFTASIDKLRGQIRAMGARRPKVVMITSSLPQEGKSEFAAGLARNAAAAGLRVILIECDLGYPSLAAKLGLKPAQGLCELLSGDRVANSDVIHEPEPRLHLIMAGSLKSDPQELLASDRMSELLAAVRGHYDLVVLDTPPILPVADALVLASQADATLMIVRWEKTARTAARDAVRLLRESRVPIMGVVMTRVDMRKAAMLGGRMVYGFGQHKGYHVARTVRP
jgi:succinoglycan biosynthesis transport protein ExoP